MAFRQALFCRCGLDLPACFYGGRSGQFGKLLPADGRDVVLRGIMNGSGEKFEPQEMFTRVQAIATIYRML